MKNRSHSRSLLPLAAISLAAVLGGCVAYPASPAYPVYGYQGGYSQPYYGGAYVGLGGGWHDHEWRERGWHGRHEGWWR